METTKVLKEHPELNINLSEIEIEYKDIIGNIHLLLLEGSKDEFEIKFNKTICRKKNN